MISATNLKIWLCKSNFFNKKCLCMTHIYLYEVLMSEAGHTQETVVTRGFVCSVAKAKTTSVGWDLLTQLPKSYLFQTQSRAFCECAVGPHDIPSTFCSTAKLFVLVHWVCLNLNINESYQWIIRSRHLID